MASFCAGKKLVNLKKRNLNSPQNLELTKSNTKSNKEVKFYKPNLATLPSYGVKLLFSAPQTYPIPYLPSYSFLKNHPLIRVKIRYLYPFWRPEQKGGAQTKKGATGEREDGGWGAERSKIGQHRGSVLN